MSETNTKEMQNNQQSVKKLLSLIKELAVIQTNNNIIKSKIYARLAKEDITNKTTEMKNKVMEQAKLYGKKAEAMAQSYAENKDKKDNILSEYQESLEAIQKEYEDRIDYVVEARTKFEDAEQESILKEMDLKDQRREIRNSPEYAEHVKQEEAWLDEIEEALDREDIDAVLAKKQEYKTLKEQNPLFRCDQEIAKEKDRREKIRDVITMCDEVLVKCEEDRYNRVNEAVEDKNNKLSVIPKQNLFQKVAGAFLHKINGAKKFVHNVVDVVHEKIYDLNNETLPAIREKIGEGIDQSIEMINGKKDQLIEKGSDVLDHAKETKEQLMQKAEEKLKQSIEDAKQKNAQHAMDYSEMVDPSLEEDDSKDI